ncbi:MAG TPA: metallophosphoesterase [bacterium]|nr:metallophosphoesterase [bacterium]
MADELKGNLSQKTVRICVLGDTHVPERASRLPRRLLEVIRGVDLIIHTGDFTSHSVYEELDGLKEMRAVRGNMDDEHICSLLPAVTEFEVAGRKIGLTHGWGPCTGLEQRVLSRLGNVDILIYGHSHEPRTEWVDKIFLVNPGSVAANRDGTQSCLLLELGETLLATPILL